MNYTLHQLELFRNVVAFKSVSRAAEHLNMTQPALSIQLKKFQQNFDIPLTEVKGKQIQITDFGEKVARMAQDILNEAEAIQYLTKDFNELNAGTLKIASVSTGKYIMPHFLGSFMRNHAGLDLLLDVSNKAKVIESLVQREVDFALVSVLPQNIEVEEELLLENKLYLVGNTEAMNENRPLIYREEGSATRNAMEQYFKQKKDRKTMTLTSNEAVKQALIAGLGYSVLPLIGLGNELSAKELHIIPSYDLPIVTHWRLIWLKGRRLSPVAEAYLKYIRAKKYEIIQNNFKWYLDYNG